MKSPVTPLAHNNESLPIDEADCALRGGHVLFVGAGPGHPDLLTVRAIRALELADVVVHDQLVSPAVLNIIHPNAKKILLSEILEGSSGSDTGLTLGTYLAECAADGHTVVRLKGGDPTIFARLREEIEPLVERSISFEIVLSVLERTLPR